MRQYPYLIIGGGLATDGTGRGIRELDPMGTIGMVSSPSIPVTLTPSSSAESIKWILAILVLRLTRDSLWQE